MAEDRSEPREINWRQLLPWTILFRGFRVALDPNKLVLAAAGILAMALGWWVLATIFRPGIRPDYPGTYLQRTDDPQQAWASFKDDYQNWALRYETAGDVESSEIIGAGDLATKPEEYEILKPIDQDLRGDSPRLIRSQVPAELEKLVVAKKINRQQADFWASRLGLKRPAGQLRTWPWSEDRGPNPYLLVTGQSLNWRDPGQTFTNWLLTDQVPVLIEPLVKLFRPIIYFFSTGANFWARLYFLLVLVWTLAVWAFFGGAITRIAAVEVTRQEKIGAAEAVRFTMRRYSSLVTAPLFPLVIVALLVVVAMIFGLFHMIPGFGDIVVDGLFWWLALLLGLAMAVMLVGLVGWPLMAATISTEGTDTWEAVSRSYSYVIQAPWHYIFYCATALVYGAVVVFFVGFMGSLTVYLAKWSVSQATWGSREPSYLFVYAPTSFHWRDLLLKGGKAQIPTADGKMETRDLTVGDQIDPDVRKAYINTFSWYNHVGAFLVAFWLYLLFLLIVGFGWSYFWSASTIIYLLMRRKVDDAELDEVYLEEEDQDLPYAPAPTPAPAPSPAPAGGPLHMVEAPTLRAAAPAPAPATTPTAVQQERPQQAPLPPASPPASQNDGGNSPPAESP